MIERTLRTAVFVKGELFLPGTAESALPDDAGILNNPAAWVEAPVIDDSEESVIPPRNGKGSSAAAWRAYAEGQGVEVDEEASRDDVIAALEAEGIATE